MIPSTGRMMRRGKPRAKAPMTSGCRKIVRKSLRRSYWPTLTAPADRVDPAGSRAVCGSGRWACHLR